MKVIVCGGRDYRDHTVIKGVIDALPEGAIVIHGGAPGADKLAAKAAWERGLDVREYPAEWLKLGRSAGPIRNQQMLEVESPDLVIAFPGGRGTDDMVGRALKAGVKVKRVGEEEAA